ncbi:hypothetical protein VB834_15830, partial [Limnoraphis robusta Tam1]|uniref:hypothetical protein n=1 Tax=Limnoraphis robusta TaxID=1118279 RepID=UPI002B374EB4|nr:hypothetical protein [Limnoraphis robusta Tam1]
MTDPTPGTTVTGVVTGFADDGDDFLLDWSGGSTVVDPDPRDADELGLTIGETVNVFVNEFDGVEIDSSSITRPDGSVILGETSTTTSPETPSDPTMNDPTVPSTEIQAGTTVTGVVTGFADDGDDFLLDWSGGSTVVDPDPRDADELGLT